MIAGFALLVVPNLSPPSMGWIDSVQLKKLPGETAYQITVSTTGARPYVSRFHSYDPPNLYTINDSGMGPVVILHGFDPQADFLKAISFRGGKWTESESIYARYGIYVNHGRSKELTIEARIPRETPFSPKDRPWISIWYALRQGDLVERRTKP